MNTIAIQLSLLTCCLFIILDTSRVNAQTWQWANSYGKSIGEDYGTIAADKTGNVYLAGSFQGIAIFGNDTLVSTGWGGPYVPVMFCKINPSGSIEWVKGITGTGQSTASTHVAMDQNSGLICLYGGFSGNVNIGGNNFHSSNGQMFLSAYSYNGTCLWVNKAGGTKGATGVSAACVDPNGNIFITGLTYDSAYFDSIMVLHAGNYLAKYNSDGKCLWARNICSDFNITGIATNGSDVVLNGIALYYGMPSFYFDSYLLDPSESMLVVASLDTEGVTQWAKIEGKGVYDVISNAGIDNNNNIYICGRGAGLIFGNDTLTNQSGQSQLFLVKFNHEGNPIWARETRGDNSVTPNNLTIGRNNNIYVTGILSTEGIINATTYFNDFPVTVATPPMCVEMFVAGYNDAGDCIGVNHAPTDYQTLNRHGGNSVTVDTIGNCFVAGQFSHTTTFGEDMLTSQGSWDIFIAKCGPFYGTGIESLKIDHTLDIYANPTTGKCTITIPEEILHETRLTLKLIDMKGKLIENRQVHIIGGKVNLNLETQAKGIYQVILDNGEKNFVGRVIIE
jgi:hypothetical protein